MPVGPNANPDTYVAPPPPLPVPAQEPSTGTESATAVVPAGAAATPAEPPAPPPDRLLVADEGYFQPGALLQFWLFGSHQDETQTQFRIRRAELKVSGTLVPELLKYKVMIDPAKVLEFNRQTLDVTGTDAGGGAVTGETEALQPASAVSVFQDFAITWVSDYADVSLGQFKIPVSWEGSGSSSKLLFPERALVSRYYGDRRDIGIQAEKRIGPLKYALGVFNGPGLNRADTNDQKDVALRLEAYPIDELMLGAVGYTSVGEREEPTTKDLVEGDLRLDVGGVLLQAEYLHGWGGSNAGARTEGHGFYAAAAYTLWDRLQPMARIGYLDPDLDADPAGPDSNDEVFAYELGVNYFVARDFAKLQLSGSIFDYDDQKTRTDVILSTQLSY